MEKPVWRVRSSEYLVNSPYLRLRKDEVELPNGTIVPDYYVRESDGYVMMFALTPEGQVVLVRQYRYGNDSVGIELPAGSIDHGEDALDCARRELAEETGYTSDRWEAVFTRPAEPVRSNAIAYAFIAFDAQPTRAQKLDATEQIDVELASLDEVLAMIRDGRMSSISSMAVAYAALDYLGRDSAARNDASEPKG
jgi:ADP-ribose pyrophosphatase